MPVGLCGNLFPGFFDHGKNPGNFALQCGELSTEHDPAGMQHHVDIARQQRQVEPHRFAHATLDAVALDGFAQDTASRQTDARTHARMRSSIGEKIRHRGRKMFAAPLVHTLIISVLAQPSIALRKQPQGMVHPALVDWLST
jgi:hypothetical protein